MADLLVPFIELRTFMEKNRIPNMFAVKVCPRHIQALKKQLLPEYLVVYDTEASMLKASLMGFDVIEVRDSGGCILCLAML